MDCDEFAEVAAELALGVLTGRERAAALAHLDGCESCREQVRELTMTGEELLGLLPSREPSAGFETRVLDRLGLGAPPHRPGGPASAGRRSRPSHRPPGQRPADGSRSAPQRAAPGDVGRDRRGRRGRGWSWRLGTPRGHRALGVVDPGAASALSTAALVTAAHRTVGLVFVYKRTPWWMYMSVNLDGLGNVTVQCQLENADGQFTTVGSFRLS